MIRLSFSSLRVRLILLVLLAVVPAMGLTVYTGMEQRRHAAGDAQREALRLVRLASANEYQLINDTRYLLAGLARLPAVRQRNPEACSTLFSDLLKQYPRYANIGAMDPDGSVFCSGVPMNRPINHRNAPRFQAAMRTRKFSIGVYRIGHITGRAILPLLYPVLDARGRVQAVMFAALDLDWLNQLAAQAELPPGSSLTVADGKGTILARYPYPERWVGKSLPEGSILKTILTQQGEGTAEGAGLDGIRRLYALTPLSSEASGRSVLVAVGIPSAVAYAEASRILERNLVGLGLVALLAVAAAWVIGGWFILRRINGLIAVTGRLAVGDLSARTGLPHEKGELGRLAGSFDQMVEALQQRETERNQAEQQLRNAADQLRRLSARLESVREEERIRIARAIHDELGQALTGLKMDLAWVTKGLPGDSRPLRERVKGMTELIDTTLQTVRQLAAELRPSLLDDLGLLAAIEWQAQEFSNRTGIACEFTTSGERADFEPDQATALFRILQEALTNVARHAHATQVRIGLKEIAGRIILEVQDNGRGISQSEISSPKSLGLMGIQERALLLGGDVEISGVEGKGTTLRVRIPIAKSAPNEDVP